MVGVMVVGAGGGIGGGGGGGGWEGEEVDVTFEVTLMSALNELAGHSWITDLINGADVFHHFNW